uniref:Probable magnesium transporter n=1 Tax=Anthurium amnicola TaxID=1678845 RepID=A0A1D1XYP8_9ARAE
MWESICLTLLATAGNNIGKVLQKKGTVILPPLSFKLKVIKAYASNRLWIIGFVMDISGALLMLKALAVAPVSVIQPVSGGGLAILSVFSHFYLKEVVNAFDWIGIALAGFGTIGVGIGGEEQSDTEISLLVLPWLVFTVVTLFILLDAALRFYKNQRREQELIHFEVVEEIIVGLESGILFGMASVISKMGFLFSNEGYSQIFVPACISISICCSATGFVFQTRGLKHGRAIVVSTCAAVASIVTGVLAGMVALGERLPLDPWPRFSLLLGWLMIIVGVILLVSSTRLMPLLLRPPRRFLHNNREKNHSLRRSGSLHVRDPSPSTIIQASSLHHLITSPGKEKA